VLLDPQGERRVLTDGWGTVRGLAWSADGREVWFTADRAGAARGLYAVTRDGTERRMLQVASNLTIHDVAGDGRVLVSHGAERAGISGQAPGESRERDLSWLDWSLLHDLSSDGRMMLLSESAEGGGELGSVYLRPIDGSPAVRLGDGTCFTFSPDGEWVLARKRISDGVLLMLPTGVGEPRQISIGNLMCYSAVWLPDGTGVALAASEPGHGTRLYHLDLKTGQRRAFSPEGMDPVELHMHPQGDHAAGFTSEHGYQLWRLGDGDPMPVPWIGRDERLIRWSGDGRSIFVWRHNEVPALVHKIDVETGERTPWRELTPPDPTGIYRIGRLRMSADASAYAYTYYLQLIDLHVIEGLA